MTFLSLFMGPKAMSDSYSNVRISSKRFLRDFDSFFPQKVKNTPLGKELIEYVLYGKTPKGFLAAVLNNSLVMSAVLANEIQRTYLVNLAGFIHAHIPTKSWGSDEITSKWIESGGLENRIKGIAYPEE